VVPVAVNRAISTDNFRLKVCNSANEIGFAFEVDEVEVELELDKVELDEVELDELDELE
jgi:hypothetical protein